ncbi:chemotaxis protein CheX [Pelosinus sp. sgz500959]|uniref:chemotaxis protein CheX n=1 Tax=Pelosinus sp. sgz500959 TaxID=3242472 RepID=UPI00366CBEA6
MDAKMINPFIEAILYIMPQLGFQNITKGKLLVKDQFMESKGVTVLVGLTDAMRGNVAYNMTEDTAKKIASTMMMGMPVAEMDEMAQSAISELTNMVTGNAATNFEKYGIKVDISPPTLVVGSDFKAKVSSNKFIVVEMIVDSLLIELNIGLL